jgi:formylglycine-generating enzyme required for sulfatase activity
MSSGAQPPQPPAEDVSGPNDCSDSGPIGAQLHRLLGLKPDPNSSDELDEVLPATRAALEAQGLRQMTRVAAGGYGVVLRAVDETTGNLRAVKILLQPDDADAQRMFQRECRILDAPEIPPGLVPRFYRAVEPAGGQPFMILEWIDGETLGSWLDAHPALSVTDREQVCLAICRAYAKLHGAHLLQRDPSLTNILVGSQQQIRLIDFGGGGRPHPGYRSLRTLPTVPVTHAFASEAVRSGQRRPSAADEVHAVGRICFTVLCGRTADQYSQETWSALLDTAGIPRDFATVILEHIRHPPEGAAADPDPDPDPESWTAAGLAARLEQVLACRLEKQLQNSLRRSRRINRFWMTLTVAAGFASAALLVVQDQWQKQELQVRESLLAQGQTEFYRAQLQMIGRSLGGMSVLPSHARTMLEDRRRSLLQRLHQLESNLAGLSAEDLRVRSEKLLEESLKLHSDHAAAIRCEEQLRRVSTLLSATPDRLRERSDFVAAELISEQGAESRRQLDYDDAGSRYAAAAARLERLLRQQAEPGEIKTIELLSPGSADLQLRFTNRSLEWGVVAEIQYSLAESMQAPVSLQNSIGMNLRLIPAGEFRQGSPASEIGRLPLSQRSEIDPETGEEITRSVDWERQRLVRITRPFRMAETEVTQGQWIAVMGTAPWKGQINVAEGELFPASWMSWAEQVEFTRRLSEKEQRTYRLPTEAEWEYACRAGSLEVYSFGDNPLLLNNFAWTKRNSNGRAQPVGGRQANSLGLFDLHGNLLENCLDRFAEYSPEAVSDPLCEAGEGRVCRGGSFRNDDLNNSFRSAYRTGETDDFRDSSLGFRVVLEVP